MRRQRDPLVRGCPRRRRAWAAADGVEVSSASEAGGGRRVGKADRDARAASRSRRMTSRACCGGGGLGDAPGGAAPYAHGPAVHDDLDAELLLVVGAGGLQQPVQRALPGRALGMLLEAALGGLERRQRLVRGKLLRRQDEDPVPDGPPAQVKVDGAHERLEGRGEQGWPDTAAPLGLSLAEEQERPQVDAGGQPGKARCADDRRAARGQDAFVIGGVTPVEVLGDGEAHHRVPEELQPFVVTPRSIRVLVQPAAVDERLRELLAVPDRKAEARRQGVGRVHHAPVDGARTSARRCSRRRPARSGSSRRPRPRSPSRTPPRGS